MVFKLDEFFGDLNTIVLWGYGYYSIYIEKAGKELEKSFFTYKNNSSFPAFSQPNFLPK